jgi:PPOX class probable F420-dependent enzyme
MNLDPDVARGRFADARRAHLATADAASHPHIVPITFVATGDLVYIAIDSKPKRSMDLKRLRNIAENPNVALLVDQYDDGWSQLWWVRADGVARILTDEDNRREPIRLLQARYPQYVADVPSGPVIEVSVERWSGWAFAESTSDVTLLA